MTKRDLIKFLERKEDEKRSAVKADFSGAREQAARKIHEEMGIIEMAGKIQALLQEACDLWDGWAVQHESCDGLSTNSYYGSLPAMLTACTDSEEATYRKLLDESIRLKSLTLDNISKEHKLQQEHVIATFITVTSTVKQMKHTKEAATYLKEFGFDLSELENPADQAQTALMVPVDTNYLFVKAA